LGTNGFLILRETGNIDAAACAVAAVFAPNPNIAIDVTLNELASYYITGRFAGFEKSIAIIGTIRKSPD
jgi:hypothetical protein